MQSIGFITQALSALDLEVEAILLNMKLSQNDKDHLMLPITQQKRILLQTLEDLTYLKEHPPVHTVCKPGVLREDE